MQSKKYEWHGSDEELQKLMSDGKISIEGEWMMATSVSFYLLKKQLLIILYFRKRRNSMMRTSLYKLHSITTR
jgi:hypothetical protein